MSILVIKKSDFKTQLEKRIFIGDELLKKEILTMSDLDDFNEETSTWHDYNLEYLKQAFNDIRNEYRDDYANSGLTFMGDIISRNQNQPVLLQKDYLKSRIDNLKRLLNKVEILSSSFIEELNKTDNNPKKKEFSKSEVFIVHGQDETAKTKTARFVEKLGFKPIILHEQASSGKTIIEKIENYSNVGFGIILYTPCDIGAKKETEPKYQNRARQNVVFEHGFLIGKIGRQNVCALIKENVEKPNDISGVVYIKMDEDEAWHLKLAKELKNSGYDVDMNKL